MQIFIRTTFSSVRFWLPLVVVLVFPQLVYAQKEKHSPSDASSKGSVTTSVTYLTLRNELAVQHTDTVTILTGRTTGSALGGPLLQPAARSANH